MDANLISSDFCRYDLRSDATWRQLYPSLQSLVKYFVYSFGAFSWRGQEDEIVEDIVQETIRRLMEYARRAELGEVSPIRSPKHMMMVIARNYCADIRRHDHRLVRIPPKDCSLEGFDVMDEQIDLSEMATDNVYREVLFLRLAHEIANFPKKQRKALLIDLANLMRFDTQLTPLQKAFLKAGINLEKYQQPLPNNPKVRSRHASLLNHAYRRVATLSCVQK